MIRSEISKKKKICLHQFKFISFNEINQSGRVAVDSLDDVTCTVGISCSFAYVQAGNNIIKALTTSLLPICN